MTMTTLFVADSQLSLAAGRRSAKSLRAALSRDTALLALDLLSAFGQRQALLIGMATQRDRFRVLAGHLASSSDAPELSNTLQPQNTRAAPPAPMLEGQIAIITGSGQGVGAAAAKLFARHGAKVAVTDIDASRSDQIAAEIREAGGEAISVPGDVTAQDFAPKIIKATIEEFGALHILVNNAGYTWDGVIHKMPSKQWEAMLAVHLTAPFRLIQAAAPHMRDAAKAEIEQHGKASPRSIINVSSTSGTHGSVGQVNYAAAKSGMIGLTKTVAKEWGAFNIRCNGLAFGFIATRLTADKGTGASMQVNGETVKLGIPGAAQRMEMSAKVMIPLQRVGTPQDAAGAMLMLASPYASYINAQMIEVTGGGMA